MVFFLNPTVQISLVGLNGFRRMDSRDTFSKECKEWRKKIFRTSASDRLHNISRKSFEANEVSRINLMRQKLSQLVSTVMALESCAHNSPSFHCISNGRGDEAGWLRR